jgi:hypothetical protein
MVLKPGHDGLAGPEDFEVQSGAEDDKEQYGGGKILRTMVAEGIIDAVVVCSRWCEIILFQIFPTATKFRFT